MRETRWPAARGRAGLLIDRPALAGPGARRARPDADLGRSRRGGRRARARRADRSGFTRSRRRARMRCGSAARARFWSRPRPSPPPTAGATAGAQPASTTAGRRSRSSGADAPQALMQATSADLAAGSPSAAVVRLWPARPAGADASGLPAACRGAVAGDAARLARRRLRLRRMPARGAAGRRR